MQQMTPGEFDHPPAHARIARFGEASLASSLAALVWSPGQAGVARDSPAIPDVSRKHLLDQHVRSLDTDPDHSGKHVDHRMASSPARSPKRSARVVSISLICCLTKQRRSRSRRNSANVFVGTATPSGVRKASTCLDAPARYGRKPRAAVHRRS